MGTLIVKDFRPLLFLWLEEKYKKGELAKKDLLEIQELGTNMTLNFARKYYSVAYESHLRQSFACVLGIINLGLEISEDRKDNILNLFRIGWDRIARTAEIIFKSGMADKLIPIFNVSRENNIQSVEKYLSELIAIHANRDDEEWEGIKVLKELVEEYLPHLNQRNFEEWIIKNYYNKNSSISAKSITQWSQGTLGQISATFIAALIIDPWPMIPLNYHLVIKLAKITAQDIARELYPRIKSLKPDIPKKYWSELKKAEKEFCEKMEVYNSQKKYARSLAKRLGIIEDLFLVDIMS